MAEYKWIEDGHAIVFQWDHDSVVVEDVICPFEGKSSLCNQNRDYCLVNRFVSLFGAELNIGKATIDGPVDIAWVPIPGDSDLDSQFAQVWIIPVADSDYMASKMDAGR